MQDIAVLVMQLLLIGATGYIFSTITSVMGKREFGNLIKITAVVLCAVVALELMAELLAATGSFIKIIVHFIQNFQA